MIPAAFRPYFLYAKVAVMLILLMMAWMHGSHHKDLEWSARWTAHLAADDKAFAMQDARFRKQEQDNQAQVAIAESIAYSALQEKQHELEKLRADVAAGNRRLRVKAVCPSVPAAPGAAQDPGVDHGGAAFLDPAAEPAYFALRAGIEQVEGQLAGCQGVLRAIAR